MDLNMSINSSSSADTSHSPELSSVNSSNSFDTNPCFMSKEGFFVFTAVSITNLLFLPLIIHVLYLGYQQFRQQRSTSSESHSDTFLYHSLAMDINSFLGYSLFFFGGYFNLPVMMVVGDGIWNVASCGQALLHLLTCVERYLGVVKPITYLRLKQAGWDRIRNCSIGCVWLLSLFSLTVVYQSSFEVNMIMFFCIMCFLLTVVSFCSISILCALKRPGPGEVGGNRKQVDKSKQRAFYTILAIMGALMFRFSGNLISNIVEFLIVLRPNESCMLWLFVYWFDLPSSLVLPLLFLKGAGKKVN